MAKWFSCSFIKIYIVNIFEVTIKTLYYLNNNYIYAFFSIEFQLPYYWPCWASSDYLGDFSCCAYVPTTSSSNGYVQSFLLPPPIIIYWEGGKYYHNNIANGTIRLFNYFVKNIWTRLFCDVCRNASSARAVKYSNYGEVRQSICTWGCSCGTSPTEMSSSAGRTKSWSWKRSDPMSISKCDIQYLQFFLKNPKST